MALIRATTLSVFVVPTRYSSANSDEFSTEATALWREIGTVGPGNRTDLRVEFHRREHRGIVKRLEDWLVQLVFQIDVASGPIAECELQPEWADGPNVAKVKHAPS